MIIQEKTKLDRTLDFVKIAVDIERGVIAAYCELHTDCAEELVSNGSEWKHVWGANVYPEDMSIAYLSMINIRPKTGNPSMEIQDETVRGKIEAVVHKFLE